VTTVEELRRSYEEELVPKLRAIYDKSSSVNGCPDSPKDGFGVANEPLDLVKANSQILYENIIQRLECLQLSVLLHRRISALEADKRRSA